MKYFFLLLMFLSYVAVQASCGLENCKRQDMHSKKAHEIEIDFKFRNTKFSFEDDSGYYLDYHLSFSYSYQNTWSIEFVLPYTFVSFDDKETSGFSNPTFNFRKCFHFSNLKPFVGLQVELPFGEDDKGITADHFELLPHLGFLMSNDSYSFLVSAGYRFSLEEDEDHEVSASSGKKLHGGEIHSGQAPTLAELAHSYVNFHGKEEVQVFSSIHKHFSGQKYSLGLHVTGRQVTAGPERYFFVYGGPEIVAKVKSFQFELSSDIPISDDKKMDWRLGFQVSYTF